MATMSATVNGWRARASKTWYPTSGSWAADGSSTGINASISSPSGNNKYGVIIKVTTPNDAKIGSISNLSITFEVYSRGTTTGTLFGSLRTTYTDSTSSDTESTFRTNAIGSEVSKTGISTSSTSPTTVTMSFSGTFGKNTSAIGLLSAQSLDEGEIWNDEGSIVCSKEGRDNWNAIDPNFVIDDNGEPWLTFGSFWDGIQLVKLDTTMHIAKGQKMKTIARRKYVDTMENPVEAPFIFKHGSYYYLFVSWDYCCKGMNSSYKVVVGRSRNIEGPYLDRNGKDMADLGGTLVIEGDKKEYEAAGHCSAYTFQGKDYFVCHGYSVALKGASILICKEITWTEDGWPTIKGK